MLVVLGDLKVNKMFVKLSFLWNTWTKSKGKPEYAWLIWLKELMYTNGRHKLLPVCDDKAVIYIQAFRSGIWQLSDTIIVAFNLIMFAPPKGLQCCVHNFETHNRANACVPQLNWYWLTVKCTCNWAKPEELTGVFPLEGGIYFQMCLFGGHWLCVRYSRF